MRRVVAALYLLALLGQLPLALAVHALVRVEPWATFAASLPLFASVLPLHGRIRLAIADRPISVSRRWLERLYFVHFCAGVASLAVLPVTLLASEVGRVDDVTFACGSAYGVGLLLAFWGVMVRPRAIRVRTYELSLPGLSQELDGLRLVQLSDLHIGALHPVEDLRSLVRKVNALAPDVVALTGDYFTSGTAFHTAVAHELGELRASRCVALVLGNHDDFGGGEPFASAVVARGVTLLRNQSLRIAHDGAVLELVGVDDLYTQRADVPASFERVDRDATVVALVHDPSLAPAIAQHGAHLILAGHTHWGQLGIPWLSARLNLARRFHRAPGGLSRVDDTSSSWLHVHPGIGATGLPARFGVAPEITLFVLRAPLSEARAAPPPC